MQGQITSIRLIDDRRDSKGKIKGINSLATDPDHILRQKTSKVPLSESAPSSNRVLGLNVIHVTIRVYVCPAAYIRGGAENGAITLKALEEIEKRTQPHARVYNVAQSPFQETA